MTPLIIIEPLEEAQLVGFVEVAVIVGMAFILTIIEALPLSHAGVV